MFNNSLCQQAYFSKFKIGIRNWHLCAGTEDEKGGKGTCHVRNLVVLDLFNNLTTFRVILADHCSVKLDRLGIWQESHPSVQVVLSQVRLENLVETLPFVTICFPGFPDVYTRITYFLDWIDRLNFLY